MPEIPTTDQPTIGLDLADPLVRSMAHIDHRPHEDWSDVPGPRVFCGECRQPWPCMTRLALRALALDTEDWSVKGS